MFLLFKLYICISFVSFFHSDHIDICLFLSLIQRLLFYEIKNLDG